MPKDEPDLLDEIPEGLLWMKLFEYAEAVAAELDTTPSAWMHKQVDNWAQASRSAARDRLRVVSDA